MTCVPTHCPTHRLPLVRSFHGSLICFKCRYEHRETIFKEYNKYGGWTAPKKYTRVNRVKRVHIEEVRQMKAKGMKIVEIARCLGVKPPAVSNCIARAK